MAFSVVLSFVPSVRGQLILNGSFENTGSQTSSFAIKDPNGLGDAVLPNWTIGPYPNVNNLLNALMYAGETTGLAGPNNVGPGGPDNPSGQWKFYTHPGPSPDGGNFVGVDGDSTIASPLMQSVSGLTVGSQYTLSFYQAAAQQEGFSGATTEKWQVTFGSESYDSTLMNTPNHGTVGWNAQSMVFTATATTQTLSFLAIGTPNGLPPFVLLDGVSLTPLNAVPEPSQLISATGLIGLIALGAIRRKLGRGRSNRT
ncbi:MAG: PEP-CTERM sorting domain-containing protein [Isosphaeraceae bacterium]